MLSHMLFAAQVVIGQTPSPQASLGRIQADQVRIAVVGDYGTGSAESVQVANLVHSLDPEFVLTVGDNNYPLGEASTIDPNIGSLYSRYIGNYAGIYGRGSAENRFFPVMGNHDWYSTPPGQPYLDYFVLPGNERYYQQRLGPVHLFMLDSDVSEPDGNTASSFQAQWLQSQLALSDAPFQVVVLHHPPYSSSSHGPQMDLQWPFEAWGADLVLQGHDHVYERIQRGKLPYVTAGNGGAPLYSAPTPIAGSESLFTSRHGAVWMEASVDQLLLRSLDISGMVVDECRLYPSPPAMQASTLVPLGSTWRYRDTGIAPGSTWTSLSFDDSTWTQGAAQLGYGDGDESTVVQSGPAGNVHITTWFRKSFHVPDPTQFAALEAQVLLDDGMVLYLNGVEVVRHNLPSGTILPSSLALDSVNGTLESTLIPHALPVALLQAGNNVIAVEVHQVLPTSSDISFDLKLVGTSYGTRLISAGSVWKYKDDGIDPGPLWMQPAYADLGWASGPAQLGYGDGDEATVLQSGPPGNAHPTTWFRQTLLVSNPSSVQALYLRVLADDGVQVWLNGQPVFRRYLPAGLLSASTLAGFSVSAGEERRFVGTVIDHRLLQPGPNVLAVEVHQVGPTSSDLSFDLELYAR